MANTRMETFHYLNIRNIQRIELPSILGWESMPIGGTSGAFSGTPGSSNCLTLLVCGEEFGVKVLKHDGHGWSSHKIQLKCWIKSRLAATVLFRNRLYIVNKQSVRLYVISVNQDEELRLESAPVCILNSPDDNETENPRSMFFVKEGLAAMGVEGGERVWLVYNGDSYGPRVKEVFNDGTTQAADWRGTLYGVKGTTGLSVREDFEGRRVFVVGDTSLHNTQNNEYVKFLPDNMILTRALKICSSGEECRCTFAILYGLGMYQTNTF